MANRTGSKQTGLVLGLSIGLNSSNRTGEQTSNLVARGENRCLITWAPALNLPLHCRTTPFRY